MYPSNNIFVILVALFIVSSYAITIPYREFSPAPALGHGPSLGTSINAESPNYGAINFL